MDVEDILEGQRFEVELVRGVVVGGDGLGIGVDHDRLDADLAQGEGGMDAAVVELDALADAVRPAAEDDDLLAVAAHRLVLFLVGRIVVGGVGFEFGGAGVDQLVDRQDPELFAQAAHVVGGGAGQVCQLPVGEALLLAGEEEFVVQALEAPFPDLLLGVDDLPQIVQEPRVDMGQAVNPVDGVAALQGFVDLGDAFGVRHPQALFEIEIVEVVETFLAVAAETVTAGLERAHALLEGLLEGPADGHGLAHRFHRRGQHVLGLGELLEGPARDLDHAVVDGRLEGGVGLAGDVVFDFVEGVADGQLGGDLGDREAGGLGGQRRGARHPRVHLNHHQPPVGRVDGELDVGAAGLDADFADDGDRRVAHLLVLAVGQGLGRGDGDRVAGVHAHGVEVLDRADDDDVVVAVAHHLEFEFLPAEQAAFEHDLVVHRQVETGTAEILEFLAVVGDSRRRCRRG